MHSDFINSGRVEEIDPDLGHLVELEDRRQPLRAVFLVPSFGVAHLALFDLLYQPFELIKKDRVRVD